MYDRISTRPFLEDIEKIWITFQLLRALEACHSKQIFHGDIKSENVLVTSWNSVYLSDFASFKPVYLPEDDPSQFSLFFDTSQRRTCYVAPERFLSIKTGSETPPREATLTSEMDIFSLGCVIAELFMEGAPTFTLAQLFKYKKGEFTPALDGVDNQNVKEMIVGMISLNPKDRLTATQYLENFKDKVFPAYFYDFLHSFVNDITKPPIYNREGTVDDKNRHLESDMRIDKVWNSYSQICRAFGIFYDNSDFVDELPTTMFPVCLDLPGLLPWIPKIRKIPVNDTTGCLIIVAMISSFIRNTSRSTSKVRGCELLLAFGERIHDDAKLDRCLPLLVTLLDDSAGNVQIAALKCLTQLLSLVSAITPLNAKIFPEYIFPKLTVVLKKSSVLVRITYASCLPVLAEISSKFLDMSQVLKSSGIFDEVDPETENGSSTEYTGFDIQKQDLSLTIENHTRILLTDSSSEVRRALLSSVTSLCVFLGKQKTNDVILSHAITYLNDKDPLIRMELFDCIVAISPFVGSISLDQYLLPLMIQTLADSEEFVVNKVLEALTILCDLGLLKLQRIWELVETCSKFMIHPNTWIRNSTFAFLASSVRWMTPAQIYCMFLPIIRTYLQSDLDDFTEAGYLNNVKEPMSRPVYNLLLTWAMKAQKTIFWKSDRQDKLERSIQNRLKKSGSTRRNQVRSAEDEQWISRLREIGLAEDKFWMLAVYKDYIYRVATMRASNDVSLQENQAVLPIQSVNVPPRNVFFQREILENSHFASKLQKQAVKSPQLQLGKSYGHDSFMATQLLCSDIQNNVRSGPSTTTVTTNVYGELGGDYHHFHSYFDPEIERKVNGFKSVSYTGDNPYIWKMLGSTLDDNGQLEIPPEFGPTCEVYTGKVAMSTSAGGNARKKREGPLGILVSNFEEHSDAVNCIAISPDHKFFVTGSDDGTIRVWDCFRLEMNVINRAVLVYNVSHVIAEDKNILPQVKCIKFIENTYTMACSLSNGKILFLRVDAVQNEEVTNGGLKLRKVKLVKKLQLETPGEYVVAMESVMNDKSLKLYAATTESRIVVLDLVTMKRVSTLLNHQSHGVITCMAVDRDKNWVLVGTMFGMFDLWDIRFELRIKSWGFKQRKPIHQIRVNPKSNSKIVYVVGGTGLPEITAWDIETRTCKEIYRANGSVEVRSAYEPIDVDNAAKNEEILVEPLSLADSNIEERLDFTCCDAGLEFEYSAGSQKGYLVTGGTDRMLRFWDLSSPESSNIFSGLNLDASRPQYAVQHTSNLKLVYEKITNQANGKKPTSSKSERPPRTMSILADQQELNRNHMSTVLDVAVLLRPFEMIISVDRMGTVKVFM